MTKSCFEPRVHGSLVGDLPRHKRMHIAQTALNFRIALSREIGSIEARDIDIG